MRGVVFEVSNFFSDPAMRLLTVVGFIGGKLNGNKLGDVFSSEWN